MNLVIRAAGQFGKLDREQLKRGIDFTRRRARRMTSKVVAFAAQAVRRKSAGARSDVVDVSSGVAKSPSQLRLRQLNDEMALKGTAETAKWLPEVLNFAIGLECYETAERLSRYALAIWSEVDVRHQEALLVPLVEALTAAGDAEAVRAVLASNPGAVHSDDRLTTHARMLAYSPARGLGDFLLPSRKLDAFSLSRAVDRAVHIDAMYKARRRLFTHEPQNYLLLCNSEFGRSEAQFCKYLNKLLAHYDVGRVTSAAGGGNILDNIAFHRRPAVTGGPLVSVIMAACNSADSVAYAVRSILQQEYQNIELLICDDASQDETMAVVRQAAAGDRRVRLFVSAANQGAYNIRNAMLGLAQGEYVTFHDADDYALPSRIRMQVAEILSRESRAVVARMLRVRPSGEFVFFKDQSALRNAPATILAAKETVMRYGPFRSVRFGGDAEFQERIRNAEGNQSVHQMAQPLMLGLWPETSPLRTSGSEALETGYLGPARRRLCEITGRQRLLGSAIIPEAEIVAALAESGNILASSPVTLVERS